LQAIDASAEGFGWRLRAAAATFLGNPVVLWCFVGMMAVRRVIADLPVFLPPGADAYGFIESGRDALSNPGAMYARSAALIATGYTWGVTWPPPQTLLAVPFALLPAPADVWLWAATNALMSAVGLYCLYRAVGARSRLTLPIFLLVVLLFTPLFEDVRLGQRGGPLLLLAGAAMLTVRRHPALAGALTGLGTSIKFYPAVMAISVGPRQWSRFTAALVGVASVVLAVTFIPFGSPVFYLTKVLFPILAENSDLPHDCFQNSTALTISRLVSGTSYSVESASGVWSSVTFVPWHLPWLAHVLTYVTLAALVAATIWAARRSGWAQPYSLTLAFSLGALVPGHVYTYQFMSMLPLTLVLVLKALEHQRWGTIALVGIALFVFLSSPCALFFPGLWTIAGLAIFGAAVAEARRFRHPDEARLDEPHRGTG
jgi:glycosyl transferase family 87